MHVPNPARIKERKRAGSGFAGDHHLCLHLGFDRGRQQRPFSKRLLFLVEKPARIKERSGAGSGLAGGTASAPATVLAAHGPGPFSINLLMLAMMPLENSGWAAHCPKSIILQGDDSWPLAHSAMLPFVHPAVSHLAGYSQCRFLTGCKLAARPASTQLPCHADVNVKPSTCCPPAAQVVALATQQPTPFHPTPQRSACSASPSLALSVLLTSSFGPRALLC